MSETERSAGLSLLLSPLRPFATKDSRRLILRAGTVVVGRGLA